MLQGPTLVVMSGSCPKGRPACGEAAGLSLIATVLNLTSLPVHYRSERAFRPMFTRLLTGLTAPIPEGSPSSFVLAIRVHLRPFAVRCFGKLCNLSKSYVTFFVTFYFCNFPSKNPEKCHL